MVDSIPRNESRYHMGPSRYESDLYR